MAPASRRIMARPIVIDVPRMILGRPRRAQAAVDNDRTPIGHLS
jgi:hypothetical protein